MEIHGYTETGSIDATIDGLRMTVPNDMANRHRQMVAEWEAAGNTIPAYVAPEAPIPPLPRLRFWLAAAEAGVTIEGVRARVAAIPDPIERSRATAFVEFAEVYRRDDPLLIAMAEAEGINSVQLDALWAWATGQ